MKLPLPRVRQSAAVCESLDLEHREFISAVVPVMISHPGQCAVVIVKAVVEQHGCGIRGESPGFDMARTSRNLSPAFDYRGLSHVPRIATGHRNH